jgi:hypothetical protein
VLGEDDRDARRRVIWLAAEEYDIEVAHRISSLAGVRSVLAGRVSFPDQETMEFQVVRYCPFGLTSFPSSSWSDRWLVTDDHPLSPCWPAEGPQGFLFVRNK